MREEGFKNYRQRSIEGWDKQSAKQVKFAEEVKEKKKGKQGHKGKGKGKDKSRASEHPPTKGKGKQGPAPWHKGQRRSVYEDPPADNWWSSWDSPWPWSQDAWAGTSQSSSSWSTAASATWFASQWRPSRGDAVCAVNLAANMETAVTGPW